MAAPAQQNGIEIPKNFKNTETFTSTMFEQLKLAGQVQRDFLPKLLPESKRIKWQVTFQPAEVVSGDIYDIARLDEKHIGFYVADVVGHGMPAALLTIFLKHAIVSRQTLGNSYQIYQPQEVLHSLNKRMVEQRLSGSQFISCCYCLLNVETLELSVARGGHPYPILIRGTNATGLDVEGPLLGIFEDAVFEQKSIQLQKGDKLLVYSDGAEALIGHFDQNDGFVFEAEFYSMVKQPLENINEQFNSLIQNRKISAAEVDDITAVWLEIR
jgi:sigma-B regulation protein RsbU (phosphoserine phosphatase)